MRPDKYCRQLTGYWQNGYTGGGYWAFSAILARSAIWGQYYIFCYKIENAWAFEMTSYFLVLRYYIKFKNRLK